MRLACADYTWPAVPHGLALDIVAGLGFDAVDIGFMAGRSHVRPEEVASETAGWAGRIGERCAARGLAVSDVFAQTTGFADRAVNHPDAAERDRSMAFFRHSLDFARRLGSPGLTLLPGIVFADEPWREAALRAAVELRRRVEEAAAAGLALSVEPHVGSVIDTPRRTAALLEMTPGLTLTLDYGHFVASGAPEADVEPLAARARHVQCRGGAPGRLQESMRANTIDFPRMVAVLAEAGYTGFLACEYVWSEWQHCDDVDDLTETVALRDVLSAAIGAGVERVPGDG
jgi:sugar phosphate isomerase/epimerase